MLEQFRRFLVAWVSFVHLFPATFSIKNALVYYHLLPGFFRLVSHSRSRIHTIQTHKAVMVAPHEKWFMIIQQ